MQLATFRRTKISIAIFDLPVIVTGRLNMDRTVQQSSDTVDIFAVDLPFDTPSQNFYQEFRGQSPLTGTSDGVDDVLERQSEAS